MSQETVSGTFDIRHVIFRSEDASFAVLAAESPTEGGEVVLAGPIGHLDAGQRVSVTATVEEHARYGPQLRVTEALELDPGDRAGALEYLKSIRHIGPSRAKQLLDTHGDAIFEALDANPEHAFAALSGLSARKAREAAGSWQERRSLRGLYVLLAPHGLGYLAGVLAGEYGPGAEAVVREDPYRLTELHGVGFATADRLAAASGIDPDSPRRQEAAVLHVLSEAESDGHTYLPTAELAARVRRLVGQLTGEALASLQHRGLVEAGEEAVQRAPTAAAERRVSARLRELAVADPLHPLELSDEPEGGLSEEQWAAVRAAFTARLVAITGGPGTGKTTLIRAIVDRAVRAGLEVALCAPTGRAARRLAEATGRRASTIHRLLEWAPGEGPGRDDSDPLGHDLLIVDEASMINLWMCDVLLAAVGPRCHVVLVGDADQLPPVGAGLPFADLLGSELAPTFRLTNVFRQAARSLIVRAAHAINAGDAPPTEAGPEDLRDFFVIAEPDAATAARLVVELAARRLPEHFAVDPKRDVQVLAPVYRGDLGVDALNASLQENLNPDGESCMNGALRVGDKLIQTRNDYETGLMNGQLAVLADDDRDSQKLLLESDEGPVAVPYDSAATLRPGYAISVHKSQGCEVPIVVLAVHRSHGPMVSRNLLYTAVTRASRACVVVGEPEALRRGIGRAGGSARHSRLPDVLRAA